MDLRQPHSKETTFARKVVLPTLYYLVAKGDLNVRLTYLEQNPSVRIVFSEDITSALNKYLHLASVPQLIPTAVSNALFTYSGFLKGNAKYAKPYISILATDIMDRTIPQLLMQEPPYVNY